MLFANSDTACVLTVTYGFHADLCAHFNRDGMKRTPLMLAARYGNLSTVLTLLHEGAHRYRYTPLLNSFACSVLSSHSSVANAVLCCTRTLVHARVRC
jgi:hypothetical protein